VTKKVHERETNMPFSTAWKLTEALLLQNRQTPFPGCHKPQLAQHVIKQNPISFSSQILTILFLLLTCNTKFTCKDSKQTPHKP